jgi:hypothetical protein
MKGGVKDTFFFFKKKCKTSVQYERGVYVLVESRKLESRRRRENRRGMTMDDGNQQAS